MNCNEFREIVDSYLCDELLTETNHDVLHHIERCRQCANEAETRRVFRARMRNAVINYPEFVVDAAFTKRMLETNSVAEKRPSFFLSLGFVFSTFALMLFTAFGVYVFQNANLLRGVSESSSLQPRSSSDLLNLVIGDHEYCAVNGSSGNDSRPITDAAPEYAGLSEVVSPIVEKAMTASKMLTAHACKFRGKEFAHFVYQKDGKLLSVLVTKANENSSQAYEQAVALDGADYKVARIDAGNKAVFVVSDLDSGGNLGIAKQLEPSIKKRFQF
ncbi:MAG: anti-sigma factor family protein [Pyrinomonadaceae bacterium]